MRGSGRVVGCLLLLALVAPGSAFAYGWSVPGDYATIAEVLAVADEWDAISVDAATYAGEPAVTVTRSIILDSADGVTPVDWPNFVVESGAVLSVKHGTIRAGTSLTGTLGGESVTLPASVLVLDGGLQTDTVSLAPHAGYGIVVIDGSLDFENSEAVGFSDLSAIKAYTVADSVDIVIGGSTLTDNHAGAVHVLESDLSAGRYNTVTISGSTFERNYTKEHGADLELTGVPVVTITDTDFSAAYAAYSGGSVYLLNCEASITGGSFSNNAAAEGASIWAANALGYHGGLSVTDTVFSGGLAEGADAQGGEISLSGVDLVLDGVRSTDAYGTQGGFAFVDHGSVDADNLDVSGTSAGAGGVFYLDSVSAANVTGSRFCGQSAESGAIVYAIDSTFAMSTTVVVDSTASPGSTVEATGGVSTLTDDTFVDSDSELAVSVASGEVTVVNTIFDGVAKALGGTEISAAVTGYNLFWNRTATEAEFNTLGGDLYVDPLFSAGFDRTICGSAPYLSATSPAINTGNPAWFDVDSSISDIGALPPEDGGGPDDTGTDDTGTDDSGAADDTAGSGEIDADGDGSYEADDCDDLDPSVHPGAEDDPFDDIDQDCDGSAASGFAHGSCGCVGAPGSGGTPGVVVAAALGLAFVKRRRRA